MQHPSSKYPSEQYIKGLQEADPDMLARIYQEFRQPVIRSIQACGGSIADGGIIFRAAVVEAGNQQRNGSLPLETPFFFQLRELAIAHYRDWQKERNPTPQDSDAIGQEEYQSDNMQIPEIEGIVLPDASTMRQTRRNIYAWRNMEKLDRQCQEIIWQEAANPPEANSETDEMAPNHSCRQQLIELLKLPDAPKNTLPEWVISALKDREGYDFWAKTQALERKIAAGQPLLTQASPAPNNHAIRRIAIIAAALLLLVAVFRYLFRDATPKEVYDENFTPPVSLMDDFSKRSELDTMSRDSIDERPLLCDQLLRDADEKYRQKDYATAVSLLAQITEDAELNACYSDAYFYMGIIELIREDPSYALQNFSKIDNLDRYGEDIYWYQALCFVQLAAQNPNLRERAEDAVKRAVSATENPERRKQAEKMLEKLK